jgi:alanine racemase
MTNYSQFYTTWVDIDLGAIHKNVKYIVDRSTVRVMAIVKANAYGHGAIPVARTAIEAGASWCGVARIEEALELRRAGINVPILLLGFTPDGRIDEAVTNGISITVWHPEQIEVVAASARRLRMPARVHLKVDTGMSRLGVQVDGAHEITRKLSETPGIVLEGIFTHFARADEMESGVTEDQERQFREILLGLEADGILPPLVHAANSAASLWRSSAFFNLIRAGIAIYGLQPSGKFHLPSEFSPALSWKAVLSHIKELPPGRGISYGHIYTTKRSEQIGTVAVGYGDGYRRNVRNQVLVSGHRVPVVGRVCMDQIMVQLDLCRHVNPGQEVVLIGKQENECITAEEVAEWWDTITYEVVCGITKRVLRRYV